MPSGHLGGGIHGQSLDCFLHESATGYAPRIEQDKPKELST